MAEGSLPLKAEKTVNSEIDGCIADKAENR
jgi:hypothetical protein